jgi:predicted phosphoribosyltransferase
MFYDRHEAGRLLAEEPGIRKLKGQPDTVVLAVPRGGVVVGYELAIFLEVPLDVIVVRKIGAPGNPEFAVGAVGEKGEIVINPDVSGIYTPTSQYILEEAERQQKEIAHRLRTLAAFRPKLDLKDKVVILVDDGIATGATMLAAIRVVRKSEPKKIVLAVPVAPPASLQELRREVDELICLQTPVMFFAVGQFYQIFQQTSDEEVMQYLKEINVKERESDT